MEPFATLRARVVPLLRDDIDTDQIIPARFLTVLSKDGLGELLFNDWRRRADGSDEPSFVLNDPRSQGARVLLAGANFGCGSSREHAPWALVGWGFRAVLARSFADIFRGNALKNGLLPVEVDEPTHARLVELLEADRSAEVAIDLEAERVTLPDGTSAAFGVDPFARHCLLQGVDELGYLLSLEPAIRAHEARTEAP
ncbi:MAG: 3-isopropylmalate dehydratase small subunit [Polyangiaceae bacterium]|nr:3-isopropylmalate dehydratase small subunit [Polyangiaceae bacterium]